MVELVDRVLGGLKVLLRAFLLQGSRRKAVAERHALPCGVSGFCLLLGSDLISLVYNQKHPYIITTIEVMVSEVMYIGYMYLRL